jgi:hypothetical protein
MYTNIEVGVGLAEPSATQKSAGPDVWRYLLEKQGLLAANYNCHDLLNRVFDLLAAARFKKRIKCGSEVNLARAFADE